MSEQVQNTAITAETPAPPRPVWTTPELAELNVWSDTAAKGSPHAEGNTTKTSS
ncbi:hypothetical protein M2352_005271 [Azospirillum fermentarium]|uniref:hypothetical protein n=1 Tax=Azospirillum fermentarium TaxID=1233114 RepID=UPI0022266FCE|nr:hypothetical protein [Azospirillum fermentarium]MCW2249588.1 hypothetical protein [Azospirillum fermentarium]